MAGSSRCWLPLMKNKEEKKKTNRIGGIAALQLLKRLARMLQSRLFQQNLTAFLPWNDINISTEGFSLWKCVFARGESLLVRHTQLATGHWCVANVPRTLKLAVRDLICPLECDRQKFGPVTFQVLPLQSNRFLRALLRIKDFLFFKDPKDVETCRVSKTPHFTGNRKCDSALASLLLDESTRRWDFTLM